MSLFDNLQQVKVGLIDYLTEVNENVNWTEFLNRYGTLGDEKILKRIRALTWVDKDLSRDDLPNYFEHYTKLINKFYPLFSKGANKVSILIPDVKNENDVIDEFMVELDQKVSTLHRLLDIYSIPYEDASTITGNEKIVIPTGSVTYKDPTKMFKGFGGLVIPDSFNNICFTKDDAVLNNIILHIESVMKSPLDEKTLLDKKYGMLVMGER